MENAEVMTRAAPGAGQISVYDDYETRNTVHSQVKLERIVKVILLIIWGSLGIAVFRESHDILNPLLGLIVAFFLIYKFGGAMISAFVFSPMRAIRFGSCFDRMRNIANRSMSLVKWQSWETPLPALIAIDPAQRILFVEGPDTGYRSLMLRPHQILDAKIEREQTVETKTKHGASLGYFFGSSSFGLGLIGGSRSKSISKVIETAFLEISYLADASSVPARLVFPFGDQRREADDWVIAIRQMCSAGRNSVAAIAPP
ncbi:MAG TPA: hypothetical protein VEJ16_08090 [Alphaproteobacteria bacterium]|nr:hypothetical protein [Alphaproteobacteria bacterium]